MRLEIIIALLHKALANVQHNAQRTGILVRVQSLEEHRSQLLNVELNDRVGCLLQHIDEGLHVMLTVAGQLGAQFVHDSVEEFLFIQELDDGQIQLGKFS